MSGDSIRTKTLLVDVQENGIIRDAESGRLIARLVDDVEFDGPHINDRTAIYKPYPESPTALRGLRIGGGIYVKRFDLEQWLALQDGGAPWAIWGQGLLEGASREWLDGSKCFLLPEG